MIQYFARRHLLANIIFFGVILLGIFTWFAIGKEEMPEFESNWVRITTYYPGAPAEDVELFVTKPIEDELKGVVGIEEIVTTSSLGVSSFRIVIDDDYPEKKEVVQDIQDAALRAQLPVEVRELPNIRQFKSSEKAILDIGIYHKKYKVLDVKARQELQKYVLSFENQLMAIPEVSSLSKSHYLKPELQVLVNPSQVLENELSMTQIKNQIQMNNVRTPIGSLEDKGESKVTAINELETVDGLEKLFLQGNYEGQGVYLKDIGSIREGFQKYTSIFKINGSEAIFINVKKSISTDILSAQKAVNKFIHNFKLSNKDSPLGIVLMDDESYAVKNRLKIIGSNGLVGFVLIILVLLIFLDAKTGFWVAMGIPFSMAFTLIIAALIGYTVNNMTLAGIIIVLGIVVDDAIIIAENIARHRENGADLVEAAINGAKEVVKPITASIITTCIAFVPLIFFDGFFGKLVKYIPAVVILMLLGSLIESILILPAHTAGKTPLLDRFSSHQSKNWFSRIEVGYRNLLHKIFKIRLLILGIFLALLAAASWLFVSKMKYVMFPREESKEVIVKATAPVGTTREETSKMIEPLEEYLAADAENVVGVRTSIALSRRGGAVKENEASILIEVKPAEERSIALNELIKIWEKKTDELKGLEKVKFLKGRWGHASGSAIEIQVQENNDTFRDEITKMIEAQMSQLSYLKDVEIEKPIIKKEYILKINQRNLIRFKVSPNNVTTALRTFVEGSILYSINKGNEEVDVRLTVPEAVKNDMQELLKIRVENQEGQLVFLKNIIEIQETQKPINITRNNFKRSAMIYANLAEGTQETPLEIANFLEAKVFPDIINKYPTALITFKGEIEDSRESKGEFAFSIMIVVLLIYMVLVVMFNSLMKPLLVLSIVPFGLAGVTIILYFHGMNIYGFFAVIGALGMIGVVVNDAIVMIDRFDQKLGSSGKSQSEEIAALATTRLRPVILTTFTTVVGVLPTAYGFMGYDSMLAEMMLTMGWGLAFGTVITLVLIPVLYSFKAKPIS